MDYKSIELQILQLEESFSKSRSNIYSDPKKQTHFDELYKLFKAIKTSDYKRFDLRNLQDHFFLLNYIFKGLEYLDNSTLNIIPYEIISCLEYALEDWIDKDNFIIATSLSNKNLDFYFESTDSNEEFNNINFLIGALYGHQLTHRLIKISLPKVLSRDYLSCVVLYHELGHFVDMELNISKKIFLKNYHKTDPTNYSEYEFLCHKREYFADLFAAQYINDASNLFLNYIAFDNPDCETHPATNKRISVVENFLTGKNCLELDEFNSVLSVSGPTELKIRYKKLDIKKSDFLKLIPQNIKSVPELHYIFKLGWDFWNTSETNFLKNFESRQKYHIINNLIEKSISNYTITEKWQEIL
ncbi:hypothetical protein [Flavobacterium panacagri]|uniref:hypothetical protein n=1 Tax=Flavobacterium panacagri TaxID=3034146 RepID=UPI0025A519BA|nr:hypothetical protein [Flavobacterium panacagri]